MEGGSTQHDSPLLASEISLELRELLKDVQKGHRSGRPQENLSDKLPERKESQNRARSLENFKPALAYALNEDDPDRRFNFVSGTWKNVHRMQSFETKLSGVMSRLIVTITPTGLLKTSMKWLDHHVNLPGVTV